MKNRLIHFAIHTDNIDRARNFYSGVFDWSFASYGPPDFLQIKGDNEEVLGALQSRNYSPSKENFIGLECTISVDNIDETIKKVQEAGGKIIMPKVPIPHVGWLTKFSDTEGNVLCAMQADGNAR